jgi:hypothetical protein
MTESLQTSASTATTAAATTITISARKRIRSMRDPRRREPVSVSVPLGGSGRNTSRRGAAAPSALREVVEEGRARRLSRDTLAPPERGTGHPPR